MLMLTTPFYWLPPTPSVATQGDDACLVGLFFIYFPCDMVAFLVADVETIVLVFDLMLGAPPILPSLDGDRIGSFLDAPWLLCEPGEWWAVTWWRSWWRPPTVDAGEF